MIKHVHISYKGGAGSGNWGHEGRPGKEGGSLPTGKAHGAYNPNQTAGNKPSGGLPTQTPAGSTIAIPRLSVPVGTLPEHQKGDADGKAAYTEWYANAQTKPNLADALAMRRYFADRAMEAEGVLAQQGAMAREESRKKRAIEEANKPEFLTPAQKKKREAAAKKAASDAAKAKKKTESEAAKKKKAEESAAKKAAAGAKKGAAAGSSAEKKAAAQEARIKAAEAKLKAKVESQIKVAESIGMSSEGFSAFRDAVATLKAGGAVDSSIAGALAGAGLIIKSGDTYTVPSAAMTLLNAINSSDAIKARAAMAKLGGTKEIGQVRMRKITRYVIQ